MYDTEWILIIIWFIPLIVGYALHEDFFKGVAGMIGILLGFVVMSDTTITEVGLSLTLGMVFIFSSLYLFYVVLFKQVEGGKK